MNQGKFFSSFNEATKVLKDCGLFQHEMKPNNKSHVVKGEINSAYGIYKYAEEVYLENDYNILLKDGSFFQFEMNSDDGKEHYRYVFVQKPQFTLSFETYCNNDGVGCNDKDYEEMLESYKEKCENEYLNQFPIYLRYDVDERGYMPNVHSYAHLHVGLQEDTRLPVRKYLTPLAFVCMAIRLAYSSAWETYISHLKGPGEQLPDFKSGCDEIKQPFWDDVTEEREIYLN